MLLLILNKFHKIWQSMQKICLEEGKRAGWTIVLTCTAVNLEMLLLAASKNIFLLLHHQFSSC